MKLLEDRILNDGNVLGENILKVDSFLTHQVDFDLMREIGKVFAEKFKDTGITKVDYRGIWYCSSPLCC